MTLLLLLCKCANANKTAKTGSSVKLARGMYAKPVLEVKQVDDMWVKLWSMHELLYWVLIL